MWSSLAPERNISWAVTRIHFFDQLNPKFFAYGGLPIYLYRALGEEVVLATHNPEWLFDWGHIAVIGRYVSAIISTISIFLIYLVGASYFTPTVGILAATLLTFSPWAIQQAHFDTTETMLVFYLLAMTWVSHQLFRKLNRRSVIQLGLLWGLAMAAKTTSLLFGIIPITAIWFPHTIFKNFFKKLLFTFLLVPTTGIIFFIFSPYTVLDLKHFLESMTYESGVALGRLDVPYTLQFLHTPPYLFQIQTMLWQAGPLVIVGFLGLIGLVIAALFKKKFHLILILAFPLLYFGWVGSWFAKFNRYNVPFLPFLTVAASWFCMTFIKRFRVAGIAFTALLLSITILWGLSNFSIYLRPQTRLTASEWMYKNIPKTAKLYTEHWNDGLPIDIEGVGTNGQYRRDTLNVYDEDNAAKKIYYADQLIAGDFIILTTRRMWATMPRLQKKYPLTKLFYQRLLDSSLGYKEVATFTSYPQLFGFSINDDGEEESIQGFFHPTVRIFQNTARDTRDQYLKLLT
ncbi:MAG: glycosyltransferase family 39 protein, partial [Candidatus Gottesmanbacteria bacterium]|nr:glycosyltransferase family 39 protein [Candidatus Gottesmanbacteria bacterium]